MRTGCIKGADGNLPLSKIVLGCCDFGSSRSEAEAFRQLDMYYDAGGRTLDTARIYAAWLPGGESASERTVGRWLKARGRRRDMTVATKGGHPPLTDMHSSRLSPAELEGDLEESLRALDTDCIDLYFLHRDDPGRPVGEIMDTLGRFIKAGKVRALGASNWTAARIREANAYAEAAGIPPFAISQLQWSLAVCRPADFGDDTLVCMDEGEYAAYLDMGLPVMAYSSQAKGVLSKWIAGKKAAGGLAERLMGPVNRERAGRLAVLSRETGVSPAALSAAYVTSRELDGYAVISASRPEQLADTLAAGALTLSEEEARYLEG